MYCFSRRKDYIRSARLFANKEQYQSACRDAGALDVDGFFATISLASKGQTWKDLLRRKDVPETVKRVFRHLQLCMANVLGTNAYRTNLRHRATGYRWLWGAPLVFTTLNPADTRHPVMRLLHSADLPEDGGDVDGEPPEVASWRLLEEGAPDLGGKEKMVERVAADPVGQALLSDLMMKLFLKHMLGVDLECRSDSVASSGRPGLFGDVKAYFAPLESQGRGGLHAHMNVWVCHPLKGRLLEKLRKGESLGPEWQERLLRWRRDVLDKVGTMEFTSIEEPARQLGRRFGAEAQLAFRTAPPELEKEYAEWCEARLQERCSPEEFAKDQMLPQAEQDVLAEALAADAHPSSSARAGHDCVDPGRVSRVVEGTLLQSLQDAEARAASGEDSEALAQECVAKVRPVLTALDAEAFAAWLDGTASLLDVGASPLHGAVRVHLEGLREKLFRQRAMCPVCRRSAPCDFLRCAACTPLAGQQASLRESFTRWVEDLPWSGLPGQGLFEKSWQGRLGVICPWVPQRPEDARPDVSAAKILVLSFLQDRQLSEPDFLEMLRNLSQVSWSDRLGPRGQEASLFVAFLKSCMERASREQVFTEAWGREVFHAPKEDNQDLAWRMQALHHCLRFYCQDLQREDEDHDGVQRTL